MTSFSLLKTLEKRIRASKAYDDWVRRNKGPMCLKCGSNERLECHHIIDLYHVILGLWKLWGDAEEVFTHAIAMHEDDKCEGVTMCSKCHSMRHPGRALTKSAAKINTDTWSVIPRMIQLKLTHSRKNNDPTTVGLIGLQTLFGIGWNILNGHLDSRIIELNRCRFASLIGKTPGASFNRSFDLALQQLQNHGILVGHHRHGNSVEIHLSKDYLDMLGENPWFVPMSDICTHSMCVLCLKWFLSTQCSRRKYYIGFDKLKAHIGIQTKNNTEAMNAIKKAVTHIPWVEMSVGSSLQFTFSSRQPSPIRSLRMVLSDALEHGH
jgi:hypothetical protein